MADFNLQGCPARKDLQRQLAEAIHEEMAAESALGAARMGPIAVNPNRPALEARLAAAQEKNANLRVQLSDHTDNCRACAELRKTA